MYVIWRMSSLRMTAFCQRSVGRRRSRSFSSTVISQGGIGYRLSGVPSIGSRAAIHHHASPRVAR
jgi:hypothetical protein